MWTSLAATVLLAGAAIQTNEWEGRYTTKSGLFVGMVCGQLTWGRDSLASPGWRSGSTIDYDLDSYSSYTLFSEGAVVGWTTRIYLWIPAAVTLAVAGLVGLKLRRSKQT